jgi:hypothetical protein
MIRGSATLVVIFFLDLRVRSDEPFSLHLRLARQCQGNRASVVVSPLTVERSSQSITGPRDGSTSRSLSVRCYMISAQSREGFLQWLLTNPLPQAKQAHGADSARLPRSLTYVMRSCAVSLDCAIRARSPLPRSRETIMTLTRAAILRYCEPPRRLLMIEASDPSESTQANPHPVSEHRTPREIALDEAGPIGQPDRDLISKDASDKKAARYPAGRRSPRAASSTKRGKRR